LSRKNIWKEPIYEEMKNRAILSSEIPTLLQGRYRNIPSSVKISAVLKRDMRFVKIGMQHCFGLANSKSHRVIVFGRADTTYEQDPPYRAIR
tara:strand:- start:14074 stop:14349 length:276 start_codon:yes stop_codon:yes gene_type:complete